MKIVTINWKKTCRFIIFLFVFVLFLMAIQFYNQLYTNMMIMGGEFYYQSLELQEEDELAANQLTLGVYNHSGKTKYTKETEMGTKKIPDAETYYRPSDLPVLNDRFTIRFFDPYFGKKASEITLPADLMKTPEETIINYFSVLREASHYSKDKFTGCGTIGYSRLPYPAAYNFLSASYQKELSYKKYYDTFENILHTSLIKYREIPVYGNPLPVSRYFVEIETIEGSDKNVSYFAYYYGFVDLTKENNQYKIKDLKFYGEDFLCAPYHGWSHNAELSVQIRYGGWCSLIKQLYPTEQSGYVKKIPFEGSDGYDYLILFFQLTNDTDIEIAQYRKSKNSDWELIKLDPEKCLKEKK